jgi:hypothetical protein
LKVNFIFFKKRNSKDHYKTSNNELLETSKKLIPNWVRPMEIFPGLRGFSSKAHECHEIRGQA